MKGWIKVYRTLLRWRWFKKPETLQLFIYCILRANHEDNDWQGIKVGKGSFITSLDEIKDRTGLSVQKIRTGLKRLRTMNEITIETTTRYTHITICNWDEYQLPKEERQQTGQQGEQQMDNMWITNGQHAGNNEQECNNEDNAHTQHLHSGINKKKGR